MEPGALDRRGLGRAAHHHHLPAQQLGAAPDHYDMARDGIADIAFVNPGYQAGRFPIIAHGEIPFLITNAKGGSKRWMPGTANTPMRRWATSFPWRSCTRPAPSTRRTSSTCPRTWRARTSGRRATIGRFVSMLGGASVWVPAPEARETWRGAADAITFPWNSLYIFGIDGITTHHLDIPLYVTTFVLVMNKTRYEGLADADRQVIDEHCTSEWAEKMASGWADWEDEGRTKMLADRASCEPTPEDVQAWRDAAAPLLDAWKADVARAMTPTPSMRR